MKTVDMDSFVQIPKLNLELVKIFLEKHKLTDSTVKLSRTRSFGPDKSFKNIAVVSIKLENDKTSPKNMSQRTLTAEINEMEQKMTRRSNKVEDKKHVLVLQFTGKEQNISSAICTVCSAVKASCSALSSFMYWIQHNQQETWPEKKKASKAANEENAAKKRMVKRECRVLLERVDVKNDNPAQTTVTAKPVLKKVQVEIVPFMPAQLKMARKLSMVHLIREFKGDDANEFLAFCTARMSARVCDTVELLTVAQADTELWHELRIGRITASRIREAARCTLLRGSLMESIMGASAGFSFAMKRGTILEGHVLAELRKEYPELRNAGLMLDPKCPWMGASPDGICDDFVLEIKCPYTAKTHSCYVDEQKLSPKYYTQIQLQMHLTKRKKSLLAVAALDFEQTKQITKVWIKYNKVYVEDVIGAAYEYWRNAIFKALLRKRSSTK